MKVATKILICSFVLVAIIIVIQIFNNILLTNNTEIKYQKTNGLIVIPSEINNRSIFDTGAEICLIDSRFADNCNLIKIPVCYSTINDKNKYPYYIIKSLSIGGVKYNNVLSIVFPFTDTIKRYGNVILRPLQNTLISQIRLI